MWSLKGIRVRMVISKNIHLDIYAQIIFYTMKHNLSGYSWFRFCIHLCSVYSCPLLVFLSPFFNKPIHPAFWYGYDVNIVFTIIQLHYIRSHPSHHLVFFFFVRNHLVGIFSLAIHSLAMCALRRTWPASAVRNPHCHYRLLVQSNLFISYNLIHSSVPIK